jgi:hypothetical protein
MQKILVGQRFGRLTVVIPHLKVEGEPKPMVIVRCDCGSPLKEVRKGHVANGAIASCGCNRGFHTHGGTNTPEYRVWKAMRQRCHSPNSRMFRFYGAKGVTVCDRWRNSFQNFIDDMGERPSPQHSIERVDVELGYCPENCTWATREEQDRNRRDNVFVVYEGQRMVLTDAAEASGIPFNTLRARLERNWPPEQLFSASGTHHRMPPGTKFVVYQGAQMTVKEAAAASGVNAATLNGRIRKGWPEDQLFSPAVKGLRPGRRPQTPEPDPLEQLSHRQLAALTGHRGPATRAQLLALAREKALA